LKRCDHVKIDIDLTRAHREIVGRYSWPLGYHLPWTAAIQLYSTKYEYPGFIGSNKTLYTYVQHGGLCAIEEKTTHYESNCTFGLEWVKTSFSQPSAACTVELAQALDFAPRLVGKTVPFLFLEPSYYIDFTDYPLDPSSGYTMLFSCKGMLPFAKYESSYMFLFKVLFEGSLFMPVDQAVVALRGRVGHIFHRHFSNIMPSERFYLGGAHSLRSYQPDLTPPWGIFVDEQGEKHAVPRGGRTMINGNAEIRFPLTKSLRGVFFQDLGFLHEDITKVSWGDILLATGFGVRYTTPFGPLRFDIGCNWRRPMIDSGSYAWFLTFGQAF
jgi:outer membrane protein assembly factor BamA